MKRKLTLNLQQFATVSEGVYPAWMVKFLIDNKPVVELEEIGLTVDGVIIDWYSYDMEGWISRLLTGKGFTMNIRGKRHVGDPGNDMVIDLLDKMGQDANKDCSLEFPNGAKIEFTAVIDVKNAGMGATTDVAPVEFDALSTGKPTFTPAPTTPPVTPTNVTAQKDSK